MTDFSDGKWHAWNGEPGDKCPVHPKSVGDITYSRGGAFRNSVLSTNMWGRPLMFRVTKPYVEPPVLDRWAVVDGDRCYGIFDSLECANVRLKVLLGASDTREVVRLVRAGE